MPRTSYTAQKTKIEKEIAKLQKQMQSLQTKQRKPVIASIVKSMKEYGISVEEIADAYGRKNATKRSTSSRKNSAGISKRKVPAKYMHPETRETWTGRGRPPRWLADAEAAGTPRDTFLIEKAGNRSTPPAKAAADSPAE